MREIILDTETTGLNPDKGDRIVEIGCVELWNKLPTGQTFHKYINPERDMPEEAKKIHGLSNEFLADKPVFKEISEDFINFISDSIIVAHNANFDMKFINFELKSIGKPKVSLDNVIDTVKLARIKFPGSSVSLDALCKRFNIDLSVRSNHGALLDASLLSEVYLELNGGRQGALKVSSSDKVADKEIDDNHGVLKNRQERHFSASADEIRLHKKFIDEKIINSLW
jgi:DNA polymerase-3 subunit epsilon